MPLLPAMVAPPHECSFPKRTKSYALNRLFDRWEAGCDAQALEFHRDGIVDEPRFRRQKKRILFVLLEPNSKGGAYDRNCGCDLRWLWCHRPLKKSLDRNLALWSRLLLGGRLPAKPQKPNQTRDQLRRVAIMNLKKLAGGGTADSEAIGAHAWQDRALLRNQIRIIAPDLVIACGPRANKVLGWVLHDDLNADVENYKPWRKQGLLVLPGNHPSLRPYQAAGALRRLKRMARLARLQSRRP